MYLEKIKSPADIKAFSVSQLKSLAEEMRSALLKKTSARGGHLASNLGVVELTIALHYVFNMTKDKIVFDVSHQCYCHKMLTGRNAGFLDEASFDSISGFTNPEESKFDLFHIGHTSTSIALACGLAKARDIRGDMENVIALIGDASLDGGEAFESLNYAGEMNTGIIVIVNDNNMSIPENHGGLCKHLNALRDTKGTLKDNFFKTLGWKYLYVDNGHDIDGLVQTLSSIKDTKSPVVVHVSTIKGKGYPFAEDHPEKWHWTAPFDIETGRSLNISNKENYGSIVGEHLEEMIQRDPQVIVVAASTPICIGFNEERRRKAGRQYVDVGIAEQNAVSFSAGIARNGGKPVFATNSTFIQRAYDQIQQEVCINRCPVTMIVTHASILGHKNITHAGIYDIPLLANIPGLVYLAPTNKQEYLAMLDWSIEQMEAPVAIRVPWHGVFDTDKEVCRDYGEVKYQITKYGTKVAVFALGGLYQLGERAVDLLKERTGIDAMLINPRFITGMDMSTLDDVSACCKVAVTLEDGILSGGFGAKIAQYYAAKQIAVLNYGFSMELPVFYNPAEIMKINRLTAEQIVDDICKCVVT